MRPNLFIEKINGPFRAQTGAKTASGLSVSVQEIVKATGSQYAKIESFQAAIPIISRVRPKKVIFEAMFIGDFEVNEIKRIFPGTEIYVHIHSNVPFMAVDAACARSFIGIKGFKPILNCKEAGDAFKGIGIDCVTLENVYTLPELVARQEKDNKYLDVACFGSLRTMKNHYAQAMAAVILADQLGKTLRFHINGTREEGGGGPRAALKALFTIRQDHQLIAHPWMEHSKLIEVLRGMDLGMQVSMTESFNATACDYLAAGIPIVVSNAIKWANEFSKADTESVMDIVHKSKFALDYPFYVNANRDSLKKHSDKAAKEWNEFLAGSTDI